MNWVDTPPPAVLQLDEPLPEPWQPPRYEDCQMTPELFTRFMNELRGHPAPPPLPSHDDGLLTPESFDRAMRDLNR